MQLSAEGVTLLRELEGVEPEPYRDSAGLLTIGCGHLLTRDELHSGKIYCGDRVIRWKDGPLSDEEITALLAEDVGWAEACVEVAVHVQLTQEQFDCLVLWTFNVGANAMRESTLVRKLNAGLYTEVPDELRRWTRAGGQVLPGLVRRREREIAHWYGDSTLA
jgi:lysozyme